MPFPIVQSSPQAAAAVPARANYTVGRQRYPWDALTPGTSFTVPLDAEKGRVRSLRTLCSTRSVGGKRYVVVVHEEAQLIEVARQADVSDADATTADVGSAAINTKGTT